MQNCKNPNWNVKTAPVTISARLEGAKLLITDAQGNPLAEVDIAPAVQAVLDTQKKKQKRPRPVVQ